MNGEKRDAEEGYEQKTYPGQKNEENNGSWEGGKYIGNEPDGEYNSGEQDNESGKVEDGDNKSSDRKDGNYEKGKDDNEPGNHGNGRTNDGKDASIR
jgi:hypothetical protein